VEENQLAVDPKTIDLNSNEQLRTHTIKSIYSPCWGRGLSYFRITSKASQLLIEKASGHNLPIGNYTPAEGLFHHQPQMAVSMAE
jgi:hypothetical protein